MSGLRDWSNEGATPEECALLAASRSEQPPSSVRSRTLAALGVGAVVTASTVTTATTASAGTGGAMALGAVAKIAGVVLVVGGVAAGGFAWRATRNTQPVLAPPSVPVLSPAPNAVRKPLESPGSALPPEASPVDERESTLPEPSTAGRGAAVPRTHAVPASSSATLSKEVAALEKAHAAIAAHDPDAALRALDQYRARFPGGALSSEEAVLRVQAVLGRGDKSNATELAKAFRASHPDSPYGRGVQDLVSNKAGKP